MCFFLSAFFVVVILFLFPLLWWWPEAQEWVPSDIKQSKMRTKHNGGTVSTNAHSSHGRLTSCMSNSRVCCMWEASMGSSRATMNSTTFASTAAPIWEKFQQVMDITVCMCLFYEWNCMQNKKAGILPWQCGRSRSWCARRGSPAARRRSPHRQTSAAPRPQCSFLTGKQMVVT